MYVTFELIEFFMKSDINWMKYYNIYCMIVLIYIDIVWYDILYDILIYIVYDIQYIL